MNDDVMSAVPVEATAPVQVESNGAAEYSEKNVQIFKDAAHIRQRPGMYIGNVASSGLHHLVYELVYNSVDEALAGHCKNIHVKINVDGSLTVRDDGRGIPVEEHPEAKRPTALMLLILPLVSSASTGATGPSRKVSTSTSTNHLGIRIMVKPP